MKLKLEYKGILYEVLLSIQVIELTGITQNALKSRRYQGMYTKNIDYWVFGKDKRAVYFYRKDLFI